MPKGKFKISSPAEGIAMGVSYFPSTEADHLAWVMHYRDQFAVHGPTMAINAEEIAATQRELDFYGWMHWSLLARTMPTVTLRVMRRRSGALYAIPYRTRERSKLPNDSMLSFGNEYNS